LTEPGDFTSDAQLERCAGVLVGQACGDALAAAWGAGDRAGGAPELTDRGALGLSGGAWSDVVALAAQVAEIAAGGVDLAARAGRVRVGEVIGAANAGRPRSIGALLQTLRPADGHAAIPSRSPIAGPGSTDRALASTAAVGLVALTDRRRTAATARVVASLADRGLSAREPVTIDACVLWSEAIRLAVVEGRFDLGGGVDLLPAKRREQWRTWIDEASGVDPRSSGALFPAHPGLLAVSAVQTAWAAVLATPVPVEDPDADSFPCQHLQHAVQTAVVAGGDQRATVAALAGALLAARWGRSAVPMRWARRLHGDRGLRARDLVRLGVLTARAGRPVRKGWPAVAHITPGKPVGPALRLRTDPGTWVGGIGSTHDADAVVSLCVLGARDVPAPGIRPENHLEAWIVSSPDPEDNPNLTFALRDTARAVLDLREEGHEVLVQCTRSRHRTPMVAVQYLVLRGLHLRRARLEVRSVYTDGWGPRETAKS